MDDMVNITWRQLWDVLDDFREWYEEEWLGDTILEDGGMNAIDYFIWSRRLDPSWPDRPPQVS
jgi:hypothetical protein